MDSKILPIIDISSLFSNQSQNKKETIQIIHNACQTAGFFYIKGHGVDNSLIFNLKNLITQFFQADMTQKTRFAKSEKNYLVGYSALGSENLQLDADGGDFKESFDISPDLSGNDVSYYPDFLPNYESIITQYYNSLFNVSMCLLEALGIALGEAKDIFTKDFVQSGIIFRWNYYPASYQRNYPLLAGAHTDYGYLTILYQDEIGGLQVYHQNEWIDVPYIENTFVVNIGDLMQMLTNDLYQSTKHRVINKKSLQNRISIPYFVEPNYNALMQCLPSCVSEHNQAKYSPVLSGKWIQEKILTSYGQNF